MGLLLVMIPLSGGGGSGSDTGQVDYLERALDISVTLGEALEGAEGVSEMAGAAREAAESWERLNPPSQMASVHQGYADWMRRVAEAASSAHTLDELADELSSRLGPPPDWDSAMEQQYGVMLTGIRGNSMDPTVCDGDLVLFQPSDGVVERSQTVLFTFPADPERDFFKRIIGEPGETVEVRGGRVYIDGQPLEEPYVNNRPTYSYGPAQVPPDHFFVLGDNRNTSYDSHDWGFLPEENIKGELPAGTAGCGPSHLVIP